MRRMYRILSAFRADERGTTAIEYAIVASMLSVVIVAAVRAIGTNLSTIFTSVSTGF